jgi:hypothetical protein
MHEIIMSTYKYYQLGMKVMIVYNKNKFKHKSKCKCNNMSHTHPFNIACWIALFLEYSRKSFRKNLLKSW